MKKRINTIINMIPPGAKKIVDVACDHGLIGIQAYNLDHIKAVICSDINDNALAAAKGNVKRENLDIECRISDGLKEIDKKEFDVAIIAGLGSKAITQIVKDSLPKLTNKKIIISTNDNLYKLRKFMNKNGFVVEQEKLVKENNVIYTVILYIPADFIEEELREEQLYFGPKLLSEKHDLLFEVIDNEIEKVDGILKILPPKYFIKQLRLRSRKAYLKRLKRKLS